MSLVSNKQKKPSKKLSSYLSSFLNFSKVPPPSFSYIFHSSSFIRQTKTMGWYSSLWSKITLTVSTLYMIVCVLASWYWKVLSCQSHCNWMQEHVHLCEFVWSSVKMAWWEWKGREMLVWSGSRKTTVHRFYWWNRCTVWSTKRHWVWIVSSSEDWVSCSDARWVIEVRELREQDVCCV